MPGNSWASSNNTELPRTESRLAFPRHPAQRIARSVALPARPLPLGACRSENSQARTSGYLRISRGTPTPVPLSRRPQTEHLLALSSSETTPLKFRETLPPQPSSIRPCSPPFAAHSNAAAPSALYCAGRAQRQYHILTGASDAQTPPVSKRVHHFDAVLSGSRDFFF